MNIKIADLSFWQNTANFTIMSKYLNGVILRAGQGSWKDIAFDISWKNAKAAGLAITSLKKDSVFAESFFFTIFGE